jgi:hypothetical protein
MKILQPVNNSVKKKGIVSLGGPCRGLFTFLFTGFSQHGGGDVRGYGASSRREWVIRLIHTMKVKDWDGPTRTHQ